MAKREGLALTAGLKPMSPAVILREEESFIAFRLYLTDAGQPQVCLKFFSIAFPYLHT
jgi:hypothetical protein